MPLTLTARTSQLFPIYRDSSLLEPLSSLTWTSPLHFGRIVGPVLPVRNLFLNGDFSENYVSNLAVSNGTVAFDSSWGAFGRHSALVTATSSNPPVVSASPTLIIAGVPDLHYSLGATVKNNTSTSRTFTLTFRLGDNFYSTSSTISAGASSRLEVLNYPAPVPTRLFQVPNIGASSFALLSFTLAATGTWSNGETFSLDGIFIGEGSVSTFVKYFPYPENNIVTVEPVRLWIVNQTSTIFKNPRIALSVAPRAPRVWAQISTSPDFGGWVSTYNRFYYLLRGDFNPGAILSFWLRAVGDDTVFRTADLRAQLITSADV